LNWQSSLK